MEDFMTKKKKDSISKENFIEFLSSMSPVEINNLIEMKGKPHKKICPMVFFGEPNDK
jgi:hypothetical protein